MASSAPRPVSGAFGATLWATLEVILARVGVRARLNTSRADVAFIGACGADAPCANFAADLAMWGFIPAAIGVPTGSPQ